MAKWADILLQGSWKGVDFDFEDVTDETDNEIDSQEFPYSDGAFQEGRARNSRKWALNVPIIEGDYPELMNRLLEKINENTPGELVHPIFGSFQAVVKASVTKHDPKDGHDCATMQLTVWEHNPNAGVFSDTNTLPALANAARSAADAVTSSAAILKDLLDFDPKATDDQKQAPVDAQAAAASSVELTTTLEDSSTNFSVSEIEAQVNTARSVVNGLLDRVGDYSTPEAFQLGHDLTRMVDAQGQLATLIIQAKPPLIAVELPSAIPLLSLIHARYGSSDRVTEFLSLNSVADPLELPRGATVRVYAL